VNDPGTFNWRKRGKVFSPIGRSPWMTEYSQVPTLLRLPGRDRVFFTTRPARDPDGLYVSRIGYVDFSPGDFSTIIGVSTDPLLELGGPGSFDEFGMMPGSFVEREDGAILLYYTGWSRPRETPYATAIGIAVSRDGGETFQRDTGEPILSGTHLANGPWVLRAGDTWHMWYANGVDWVEVHGSPEPIYLTHHAVSEDGVHWESDPDPCFPTVREEECNGAPTVVRDGDCYHMWFCHRSIHDFRGGAGSYRMGYARSADLVRWEREDGLAGIDVSPGEWDGEMVAYPRVYRANGGWILFYNGNDFGREGFGLASSS
jgi:sucrose-6-phosphate hydrolase SacC (GH32 family)